MNKEDITNYPKFQEKLEKAKERIENKLASLEKSRDHNTNWKRQFSLLIDSQLTFDSIIEDHRIITSTENPILEMNRIAYRYIEELQKPIRSFFE